MFIAPSVLDAHLEAITAAHGLIICDVEPSDYDTAEANVLLRASVTYRGPMDDGQGGRIVIVEASSGYGVRSGDALWAALVEDIELLLAVPCTGTIVADVLNTTLEWCISAGIEVGCIIMDV